MASSTDHLKDLNRQYKAKTGEDMFLYASTLESSVRLVFVPGVLTNLSEAESFMRWALAQVENGVPHVSLAYGTVNGRA